MSVSHRTFLREMFLEHIEEASFLYEQRLSLLEDPEVAWTDLESFEDRLEAHLDALVLGETLALDVCRARAIEGDFGELHAAARVFCRQRREDLIDEVLQRVGAEDQLSIRALADAVKYETPARNLDGWAKRISAAGTVESSVAALVIGYHRAPAGDALLEALDRAPAGAASSLVWALGRLRERRARGPLKRYLEDGDDGLRSGALIALQRTGDLQASVRHVDSTVHSWAAIPMALGADPSAARAFAARANSPGCDPEWLIALGLLGDTAHLPILLAHLGEKESGWGAAMALQLITGSPLYEDVFVPEEVDPDTLLDEERGELPEVPLGVVQRRISQDAGVWRNWLEAHREQLRPPLRYRNGVPYSPQCLLQNLRSETSPPMLRRWAIDELVVRYGLEIPFETDMTVIQQKQRLAEIEDWIRSAGEFQAGSWYFAGRFMA